MVSGRRETQQLGVPAFRRSARCKYWAWRIYVLQNMEVGSREWYAVIHIILPDNFDTLPQKEKSRLVAAAEIGRQMK